jgi:hypothetical protein
MSQDLRLTVFRAVLQANHLLNKQGLTGVKPGVNLHKDMNLPIMVYHTRTNTLVASEPRLRALSSSEVEDMVRDAMAMCGCQRSYQADLRSWNGTQNKARMAMPVLGMHGGPKWRSIRSKLDKE